MFCSKKMDGDVPLSSTGKRQLAFELTAQPESFKADSVKKVFCSPLRRALLTALAAYPNHKITVDPRLREVEASGGLDVKTLRLWLQEVQPDRVKDVDFSRLPSGVWWGREQPHDIHSRFQSFLADVHKLPLRTGFIAIVGHSIAMQNMAGFRAETEKRPFPKAWGRRRGWPMNFKPYFANINASGSGLHLAAHAPKSARLILVRHAHSAMQAARRARKRLLKMRSAKSPMQPLHHMSLKRKSDDPLSRRLDANGTKMNAQEKFRMVEHGKGVVSLRCADENQYVCVERTGKLHGSECRSKASSKFSMIGHADGTVSLRSAYGKHICARRRDGSLMANRSHIKAWEKFTIIKHGRSTISFRSAHGRYVRVR